MQNVQSKLEANGGSATFKELMIAPELGGPSTATRSKATSLFMGLLAYTQIGEVDMNQEAKGKVTCEDVKAGKFRDIQVSKSLDEEVV